MPRPTLTAALEMPDFVAAALNEIDATNAAFRRALDNEAKAIRFRDDEKVAIVNSLLGNLNPMTSKPHSATSAAEAAEQSPAYREMADKRHAAQLEVEHCKANQTVATLRARAVVAMLEQGILTIDRD